MSYIKHATPEETEYVIDWLRREQKRGTCPFYANREQLRKENAVVLIHNGCLIGYMAHRYEMINFLVIKNQYRGRGFGTRLFRYKENITSRTKGNYIQVQPWPLSSISFWKKMGFTYYEELNDAIKNY